MKWSLESQQKFQRMFENTEVQHIAEKYSDGLDVLEGANFMGDCVDEMGGDLWGVAEPVYSKEMSEEDMIWEMLRFISEIVFVRGRDRRTEPALPCIKYRGRIYVLKTTRFKCLVCQTFCETSSTYLRDMKSCQCGEVSIDGGINKGATLNGNPQQMEDCSVYITEDSPRVQLSQEVVRQRRY